METLILYSSRDGQTKKIADFIAKELSGNVTVQSLHEVAESSLVRADRIIIGASIRYGHFERALDDFVKKQTALLNKNPSAFVGVNLTARKVGKDTPETNVYVRKFLRRIQWKPELAAVFAGALRYPRYRFLDRIMIQLIMKITGGETDPTKEIEYTDWQKVKAFAEKLT